jgi:subtilisin family serine protease
MLRHKKERPAEKGNSLAANASHTQGRRSDMNASMIRKGLWHIMLLFVLAGPPLASAQVAPRTAPAPVRATDLSTAIPGQYIVVLREDASADLPETLAQETAQRYGARIQFIYGSALKGFAAELPDKALEALRWNPRVAYIEANQLWQLGDPPPTGAADASIDTAPAGTGLDHPGPDASQDGCLKLDRIDQRNLPYSCRYYWSLNGAGVNIFIIDSGIRLTHEQFGGRARFAFTAVDDNGDGRNDPFDGLCNTHGTSVGSVAAGHLASPGIGRGVAKAATLYDVRVMNCNGSGTSAAIIAGINYAKNNNPFLGSGVGVANLSLGLWDPTNSVTTIDTAVTNLINSGVPVVISAGNGCPSNTPACGTVGTPRNASEFTPARVAAAITVGATDVNDSRVLSGSPCSGSVTWGSNYGSVLDLFAPGTCVGIAYIDSTVPIDQRDKYYSIMDGTSFSAPYVTGVVANYKQVNPTASPASAASFITSNATSDVLTNVGTGSPNLLLFSPPCAANCTKEQGTVPAYGNRNHPNGSYYYSTASGYHNGWLRGPTTSGLDLDLYLLKWTGSYWSLVASSTNHTDKNAVFEEIAYYGSAGYYTWQVTSYNGSSSSYEIWFQHP